LPSTERKILKEDLSIPSILIEKSWIRLEPNSYNSDCTKGVQAYLHDPQWLLSRQWALGEFEGEDASSIIYAKIDEHHESISKIRIGEQNLIYDPEYPLEVYVERTNIGIASIVNPGTLILDLEKRMKLGLYFKKQYYSKTHGLIDEATLKNLHNFLASSRGFNFILNADQEKFELEITSEFISVIKDRIVDIYKLFDKPNVLELIEDKLKVFFEVTNLIGNQILIRDAIKNAFDIVIIWWGGSETSQPFFEQPNPGKSSWDPKKLEYDFTVQFGNDDSYLLCDAKGYKEDCLNWYSFTVGESHQDFELSNTTEKPIVLAAKHLKIPGQPEKRFFNFEDGKINFAEIKPTINDLITLLLMQFSFVQSADWYMIPFPMTIGTISKIRKFTVVDTFGDEKEIELAGYTSDEKELFDNEIEWDSWNAFMLSKPYQDNGRRNTQYFFLPPVISDYDLGVPHEEIKFLRDETANLTWAIEKKYRTLYGEPINGYDHYFYRLNQLLEQNHSESEEAALNGALKYSFMTSVPWNWIPFIPVHASELVPGHDKEYKQIVYRRAALFNPILKGPITPNSRLLNEIPKKYYVDESIIPRTGIIYTEQFQRTTWFTGREFLWIGRKKRIGTGEGSSGLRFDVIPCSK